MFNFKYFLIYVYSSYCSDFSISRIQTESEVFQFSSARIRKDCIMVVVLFGLLQPTVLVMADVKCGESDTRPER